MRWDRQVLEWGPQARQELQVLAASRDRAGSKATKDNLVLQALPERQVLLDPQVSVPLARQAHRVHLAQQVQLERPVRQVRASLVLRVLAASPVLLDQLHQVRQVLQVRLAPRELPVRPARQVRASPVRQGLVRQVLLARQASRAAQARPVRPARQASPVRWGRQELGSPDLPGSRGWSVLLVHREFKVSSVRQA